MSGTPTTSTTDPSAGCDFATFVGSAPAGYQDIWFTETFAGSDGPTDNGTLVAEFQVDPNIASQDFQLLAATAFDEVGGGLCVETETMKIHTIAETVPAVGGWGLVALGSGLFAAALLGSRRRV